MRRPEKVGAGDTAIRLPAAPNFNETAKRITRSG
jgi:hypothetical protein